MSVGLQNLHELCDDQLDMVMKVERFRTAILEDVENLVPYKEKVYSRQVYQAAASQNASNSYALYGSGNNKNISLQAPLNSYSYGAVQQPLFYQANMQPYGLNQQQQRQVKGQMQLQKGRAIGFQKNNSHNGYQLKVAGVVTGSWATRSQAGRANRAGMVS
jgi:hypothetical protein